LLRCGKALPSRCGKVFLTINLGRKEGPKNPQLLVTFVLLLLLPQRALTLKMTAAVQDANQGIETIHHHAVGEGRCQFIGQREHIFLSVFLNTTK
jgi:hypothetical protein